MMSFIHLRRHKSLSYFSKASLDSSGLLLTNNGGASTGHQSLNLSSVGGVSDEDGQLLEHLALAQLHNHVVLIPELLIVGLGALAVNLDGVEAEFLHHTASGLVSGFLLEVRKSAKATVDVLSEGRLVREVNELLEEGGIFSRDNTFFDEVGESELEHVITVVLPHSSEVRLIRDESLVLMGIDHILLGDELGDELAGGFPLLLELLTALWGSGVNTEHESVFLISLGE